MTQIGEMVTPPEVDVDQSDCPFDHEAPEPPTVENSLIGVGGTLGRKMKNAEGTRLYAPMKQKVDAVKNPKDVSSHPFYKKNRCVKIVDGENEYTYPVSCAAHHCVPAQESLKESPLLTFMVKKGDSEKLKDATFADGIVWSDVGYDVNGSQNGVYLPGSYAVGGGRGGMGVWASTVDGDEDDAEPDVADVAAVVTSGSGSNELTGDLNEISASNRKWQYVKQAVRLCPGQFHDRHLPYSQFVQGVLKKMFENYRNLAKKMVFAEGCSKCKDRAKLVEDHGIPTPYGLVPRIDATSGRFAGYLNGHTWRQNIFTSMWGKHYMQEKLKGNAAAD